MFGSQMLIWSKKVDFWCLILSFNWKIFFLVLLMEIEFWLNYDWHIYEEAIDCLEYHNNFMCVMSFSLTLINKIRVYFILSDLPTFTWLFLCYICNKTPVTWSFLNHFKNGCLSLKTNILICISISGKN